MDRVTSIAPGKSLKLSIGYVPNAVTTQPGTISLTYDIAPPNGVSLIGNGVNPTAMGIETFPTLATGTPSYAYQANLVELEASLHTPGRCKLVRLCPRDCHSRPRASLQVR